MRRQGVASTFLRSPHQIIVFYSRRDRVLLVLGLVRPLRTILPLIARIAHAHSQKTLTSSASPPFKLNFLFRARLSGNDLISILQ